MSDMAGFRTIASIFLLLAALHTASGENIEVKRVEPDSLVSFLRGRLGQKVYFLRNEMDKATYSVAAGDSESFVSKAMSEFRSKGYTVSSYDGRWFITSDLEIASSLPYGYFSANPDGAGEMSEYTADDALVASFQNRVYEIGDKNDSKTGKACISGFVKNIATGEPVIGASVYNEKNGVYTVTDAYGFYTIMMPLGEGELSYSGYSMEEVTLNLVVNDDGNLDVLMKEHVTSLKEAVVSADRMAIHRNAKMGMEKIRINTLTKVPVAFGEADVLKVVQTLPGVKTVGEASSGFNVRGGSVDQNLILFNEGTIYNPSHMFGIFSAFNTEVINDLELYKSSIPAEFGGRISSVLDIKGREGNANKVQGSLGIGLLTSRFHLEGPFKKGKTTFLIGGRTTYSNWMMKLLPASSGYSGGKAQFFDVNASVTHKFNERNSIQAYGYYSRDKFSFRRDTVFHYSNLNAAVKWRSTFGTGHSVVAAIGYDEYGNTLDNTVNETEAYKYITHIRQAYAKANFKSIIDDRNTLVYGLQSVFYIMSPGTMKPLGEKSFVKEKTLNMENALEMALFAGETWTPNSKFTLDAGVRFSGFVAMNPAKFYCMPEARLSAKYSFLPNLSLKAGFNTMRQYIHLVTNSTSISPMDTWKLSDKDIRPQDGWQASAGMYWSVANNRVDLSLEGYYKQTYNHPDYKSGAILVMNDNIAEDLVPTKAQAYGVEFMVKKPQGKLNGWISYTYSRSLLKEMHDRGAQTINGGAWYPAAYDKPHDLKVVANYKFTHRYSVSMNIDYSTGRPVTVPVGTYDYGGGMRLAYSERNAYRIPDYFRMDLAMSIEPGHNLKKFTHASVTFGVYNVTARKNAYSVYFTTTGGNTVRGYKLSVFACPIPYVNLNLKF